MEISLSLLAVPSVYVGSSPALITFNGLIAVSDISEDCQVTYRFIRSDGAKSQVKNLVFNAPSDTKLVKDTWILGSLQYSGWEAIEVLSPEHVQSGKATFIVDHTGLLRPFQSLSRKTNLTRDVLLILMDPKRVDAAGNLIPVPTIAELRNLLTDVQSYFAENSNGLFNLNIVGVLGPYSTQHPWSHYDRDDPGDFDQDGWEYPHSEIYAEAIRSAAANFDFEKFLRNNDRVLSPDELTIVVVTPGASYARGFVRPALASDHPRQDLKVNDITFSDVIDMYTNLPPLTNDSRGGLAHEFAHLILGHSDMYYDNPFNPPDRYQPFRPGSYTIMDRDDGFFHLDPFCKMKYGWLTTNLVTKDGRYTIGAVETAHEIHVLGDDTRVANEYFIVENRTTSVPSWDVTLPDSGLAIWHIIEDPSIYENLAAPRGVSDADWQKFVPKYDWGRRAVRLIRADASRPLNDARALWHGPGQRTAELYWADETPAFQLHSISPPGAIMSYTLVTKLIRKPVQTIVPALSALLLEPGPSTVPSSSVLLFS